MVYFVKYKMELCFGFRNNWIILANIILVDQ